MERPRNQGRSHGAGRARRFTWMQSLNDLAIVLLLFVEPISSILSSFGDLGHHCFDSFTHWIKSFREQAGGKVAVCKRRVMSRDLKSVQFLKQGFSGFIYESTWSTWYGMERSGRYARKDFPGVDSKVFEDEAARLVNLDHPNVVKTYCWTVDKVGCSLVMEFVNDDLESVVRKRKAVMMRRSVQPKDLHEIDVVAANSPFELVEAMYIMWHVAAAMEYLHSMKVAHGDLRPNNVMVDLDPGRMIVKVVDFGLSESKKRTTLVSKRAKFLQILEWKAPELCEELVDSLHVNSDEYPWTCTSEDSDDFQKLRMADRYSFAILCIYIMGGKVSYPKSSLTELQQNLLSGALKPKLPSTCPRPLNKLIGSCWSRSAPEKRINFHRFKEELEDIIRQETTGEHSLNHAEFGGIMQRWVETIQQMSTYNTYHPAGMDMLDEFAPIKIAELPISKSAELPPSPRTKPPLRLSLEPRVTSELALSESPNSPLARLEAAPVDQNSTSERLIEAAPVVDQSSTSERSIEAAPVDEINAALGAGVGAAASIHSVCTPPKLVAEEFKEFAERRAAMTVRDLTRYLRERQGEVAVTEGEVRWRMDQFIDALMRSSSSRLLHKLGFSSRGFRNLTRGSGSSRSKQELLAVERPERAPPTFTIPLFLKFLLNPIYNDHRTPDLYPPSKTVTEDMTAPLSDYYIFASHNTYLTGNQLTSKSSTEPITKALLSGCRVIELDCWNGSGGTIKVTHGNTLTKSVGFEECIKAIKDNAFIASEYPVIVTIENHLSQANQKQAANILKRILGKYMFIPSANDRPPVAFLSPDALKTKIIISDKPPGDSVLTQAVEEPEFAELMVKGVLQRSSSSGSSSEEERSLRGAKQRRRREIQVKESRLTPISDEDSAGSGEPTDPEFEELLYIHCQMVERQKKGGPLVPGQHAIMANLSESQLDDHMKSHPKDLIEFSKRNLARVYPLGLRFDSSNADPMDAWSHGIQVAAINMQGKDRAVWISKALFSMNGACGYVKKPALLLPGSPVPLSGHESFMSLPPKLELKVRVLMGTDWHRNYDVFKKPDYFVKVAVHGMFGDGVKKHTKWIRRSREPHWDKEFSFQIRVPELAILRLEVKELNTLFGDDMVGQSCVPVTGLRQGIRAVKLKSKEGHHRNSKLLCEFRLTPLSQSHADRPMTSASPEPVPGCWG